MTEGEPGGCEPGGLRERKKRATRQALGYAAMQLAVERGLDNVLVEDIAAAAGVSPRTFSNYFTSKYEAFCSLQIDRAERIGEALRQRPPGEPLWDAISHVVLEEYGPGGPPRAEWLAGLRMAVVTPALRGEYLKVLALTHYALAAAIAERTGADQHKDIFPRILAGAVTAACQAASERWLFDDPPAPMRTLIREALSQLADGMLDVIPGRTSPVPADSG
ncbi:MAG: TetR/AcrR family transcriptional regulator [Streptosporangiaceae bacterium]